MSTTDQTVIRGSGNVFADLGLPNPEQHQLKASVVTLISRVMKQHGLSQTAAAARMGVSQPDLSKLLRGHFQGFTLERLLLCAKAIGVDFEIRAKAPDDINHEGRIRMVA